ncbi:MAG: hypothetical protein U1E62_11505 [Alsobacter sp.]
MRRALLAGLSLLSFALVAPAGRAAELWGLEHESIATYQAKVVDLLCTVAGSCVPECGGGKRQLGLLTADGRLRAAVKASSDFAGPVLDLQPYCGKTITVDGLLVENPRMTMMFVQRLRETDDQPWVTTDGFLHAFASRFGNGNADDWVRKHPEVKAIIAADGVFGIPGLKSKSPDVTNPDLKAP